MPYPCPRCGQPVKRTSSSTAAVIGGMVGSMIASAFNPFECPSCGLIPSSEFPPEVRKQMTMGAIGLVAGAVALAIAVLAVIVYVMRQM